MRRLYNENPVVLGGAMRLVHRMHLLAAQWASAGRWGAAKKLQSAAGDIAHGDTGLAMVEIRELLERLPECRELESFGVVIGNIEVAQNEA